MRYDYLVYLKNVIGLNILLIKILCQEQMFGIMLIGTFNGWVICQSSKEGRRYNEQERFFNSIFSNSYLPISIITICSINIKRKIT